MTRSLRQDAALRREKILLVAEQAFARDGLDVPLHQIAEEAGVGRATLYRNFADRSELALAVFLKQIDGLAANTETFKNDPDAFIRFLEQMTAMMLASAGLASAIRDLKDEALAPIRQGLKKAGAEALAVSQAAGTIRADLTVEDIRVIALMLGAPARTVRAQDRAALSHRSLELVLDAVRPQGNRP